ncbi:hypothetical protein GOP47_0030484 [Adiantum capillus-veneris]|nr:hypothetical protein GOP47_0030213 [Adiantum capillus-veneris]KAI5055339.1 hypothetical protein GOP47_0030484 [Adiantum capillus-veneris]
MSPFNKLTIPRSPSYGQRAFDSSATRSLSLPSFRRWRSFSRQKSDVFIVRSLSISGLKDVHNNFALLDVQSDEKEVPEDEAVCRICMLELEEGNEMFRMECSCKGELALAHKDCAMKWFSVKGNNLCDICNSIVRNLPVLLFRRSSSLLRGNASTAGNVGDVEVNSSWRHTAALLLSSALTTLWHKLQDLSEFP